MNYAQVLSTTRALKRACKEDLARFTDVPVGNIVDALGRSGAMATPIKPITKLNRFIGTALTVNAGPRDNLAPWAALRLARPGDVMVIATGGYMEASVAGDIMMTMAKNAGVSAMVTDGVVRDITGANASGIPVFAAGVNPNSPQKNGPGSVGLPVVVGGVAVAAGDIICGDEDGVVVIPAGRIGEAAKVLASVRAKEAAQEAAFRGGAKAPAWIEEVALDDLFTFVD